MLSLAPHSLRSGSKASIRGKQHLLLLLRCVYREGLIADSIAASYSLPVLIPFATAALSFGGNDEGVGGISLLLRFTPNTIHPRLS